MRYQHAVYFVGLCGFRAITQTAQIWLKNGYSWNTRDIRKIQGIFGQNDNK